MRGPADTYQLDTYFATVFVIGCSLMDAASESGSPAAHMKHKNSACCKGRLQ